MPIRVLKLVFLFLLLNSIFSGIPSSFGITPFENLLKCESSNPGVSCPELVPAIQDAVQRISNQRSQCDSRDWTSIEKVSNDLLVECPLSPEKQTPSDSKPTHPTPRQFIDYLAPRMVVIQRETGIPASYLLAQAALESGWGKSPGYSKRNSLFGYSCQKPGQFEMKIPLRNGTIKTVTANCNWPRPEGGYYYSFKSIDDGLWGQVYLLLYSPENAKNFSALRSLLHQVTPPQHASPKDVIMRIVGYAKGSRTDTYQHLLFNTIQGSSKLFRFDYCQ